MKGSDLRSAEIIKRLWNIDYPSVAEIGVWRGGMSRRLMYRQGLYLLMVDPWGDVQTKDDGYYEAEFNGQNWEEIKQQAINGVKWAKERVRVYQGTSEGAASFFDEKFDLVFIDAEHTYEACSKDIAVWWPKVAEGGYLSGHDYRDDKEGFGVIEAVNEFAEETGLEVVLGENYTWFIKKPIAHHQV
jgi:hypothetical protein